LKRSLLPELNRWAVYGFLLGLLSIILIHFINGENNIIKIYDNLDSEITTRLLPIRNGNLFTIDNDEMVPQMGIGFKRNSLNASAHSFDSLLFYLFPPIYAYLVNFALANLIAFFGMYLLFSRYLLRSLANENKLISAILAFSYTLLPTYTIYGIAVMGAPLLAYCVLNVLYGRHRIWSWAYIVFYPFYSSLVLAGHVVVGVLFVTGLWLFFRKEKKMAVQLMGIALLIGVLFVASEMNLFNQYFFDKEFVSHRSAWDPTFDQLHQTEVMVSAKAALLRSLDVITKGEINAMATPFIILLFLLFMLIFQFRGLKKDPYIFPLIFLMIAIALLYGFYFSNIRPWIFLKNHSSLLKTFRIDRIFFFLPVMYYILFALLIKKAIESGSAWKKFAAYVFLLLNMFFVPLKDRELKANVAVFLEGKPKSMISWKKFFAEDLYAQVKKDIGLPQDSYRVVSLGIQPAIALYNGFYTLDFYSNNYPLEYKLRFREIIAPELEKSPKWKASFDKWGGDCFIVSRYVEERPEFIPDIKEIPELAINTEALYNMGGRYLFSAMAIQNHRDLNLEFVKKYTDPETPLELYLYKVLPPETMSGSG
jgi:hypothetical protein